MRSNQDKTAQICALYWMPLSEAEVDDHPGQPYISVGGTWTQIPFSKAELKEDQPAGGKLVKQELKATVTGVNPDAEEQFIRMQGEPGLLRVDYTNGMAKVIGSEQVPVQLSMEISGASSVYTLSSKRSSPEFSKYFKSF